MSKQAVHREPDPQDREAVSLVVAVTAVLLLGLLTSRPPEPSQPGAGWLVQVTNNLAQRGYDWLKIDVADGVAVITGEAPDVDSRQYGVEAAEKAIDREDADNQVGVVVDATSMEGGTPSVGAALVGLGEAPTADACQRAFVATLDGRSIAFDDGATLAPNGAPLLNALSALAIRCKAWRIEVGGHTGFAGSDDANRALSQARAESVVRYLVDKGAPATALDAHGYGDALPLDPARTPAADARNQRIEFTVSAS